MESDAALSPMAPETVPADYPRDLEQWCELPSGDRMFIRPIIPEDVARLEHAFAQADTETLRMRFFTAAPPADRAHLEYLVGVDYRTRLALLAMDQDGAGIAVARYEHIDATTAEIAIVVSPEWRRRKAASILLRALEPYAARNGYSTLKALYLPSNKAVEGLLSSIGYGHRTTEDDLACVGKQLG